MEMMSYSQKKYSSEEIQLLRSFPVVGILSAFGKRTDHLSYMYFSPFRDERTPSMKIDSRLNLWHDKGIDVGGTVFDMVMRLRRGWSSGPFSYDASEFLEACDYIASLGSYNIALDKSNAGSAHSSAQQFVCVGESDVFHQKGLLAYAYSRGIDSTLLSRYCKEVSYYWSSNPRESSPYTAIGFANDKGGYVLRARYHGRDSQDWRQVKICTKSSVTTIGQDGSRCGGVPTHPTLMVFEGFFNFLSWLSWSSRQTPGCDVLVLNSTSNLRQGSAFITAHRSVCLCLDNDSAGVECAEKIFSMCAAFEHITVHDLKGVYAREGFNDFNDFLISRLSSPARGAGPQG